MINSPLDYSGCVIWLDGSNSTYFKQLSTGSGDVSNNDPVGYWQNLGSLSSVGHFTNIGGSTTTRPTYISSLSCLRFRRVEYLTLSAAQTYTAQTVFAVFNTFNPMIGSGQYGARIFTQAPAGTRDDVVYGPISEASVLLTFGSSTQNFFQWDSAFVLNRGLSAFHIGTSRHTGTSLQNFCNGVASTSVARTLNHTMTRSRIGRSITDTGGFDTSLPGLSGDISEVIVYNRALTDLERADVEYYLTRKWSVLNSIPRQVYAIKNGVWSDTATWSVSGYSSPWGFPVSADDVYSNSFTVTADQNVFVQSLRTAALSPNIAAGGTFAITQPNITITASPSGFLAGTTACVTGLLSSGTSVLSGNATGGSAAAAYGVSLQSTGNLTLSGNVLGGTNSTAYGAFHNSTGNLTIVGNVSGSATATSVFNNSTGNISITAPGIVRGGTASNVRGVHNSGVGNVYVTGNCLGGTGSNAHAVLNGSIGAVIINGNVSADSTSSAGGAGVVQSSDGSTTANATNGTLLINGNIFAGPAQNGVVSGSTAARNEFTGALINSDNGRQAAYVARYLLRPKVFDSYTFHRNTELVNLLTFSEQIDNAAWSKVQTTVTPNVSANPINGRFTGDVLLENFANDWHWARASVSTALSGLSSSSATTRTALDLVFSAYLKQVGRRYAMLVLDTGTNSDAGPLSLTGNGQNTISVIYDLQQGTMTALSATGAGVVTLSSIQDAGNGWYRCAIGGKINRATTPFNVFPTIAISDRADYSGTRTYIHYPSYTGVNNLSGIAIWGAQFEYNSLTPYVSSEFYQGFANRSAQPVFFYSPEAYALSYVPHVSSVRLGTRYAAVSTLSGVAVNITEQLTGTMIVPSEASVSLGTLVGQTTGTAINTSQLLQQVWNTNINTLTAANAIGTRLKNAVTVQEVGTAAVNL